MSYEIINGDCLVEMPKLIERGVGADLIVTSPPYNCRKQYGDDNDQVSWLDYYAFMERFLDCCYALLREGGTLAINVPGVIRWQAEHAHADSWSDYDPTYKTHRNGEKGLGKGRIEPLGFNLFAMMRARDAHMREPIIWVKGSEGNAISSDYRMGCDSDPYMRPAHEMILLGSKGRWFHRGGTGRRGGEAVPFLDETKDVWFLPPVTDSAHPAPFPVELPLRLINLFTHAKDSLVVDPFCGTGTTGVACTMATREFIGIERDEHFSHLARKRNENWRGRAYDIPRTFKRQVETPLFMENIS
jgi:DNA modification methylase